MTKRDKLVFFVSLLFIASFFFPLVVVLNVFAMGLLVIVTLAQSSLRQKIKLLKERKYIWFMLAFAGMLLVSFLLSDNRHSGLRALELRIPLLLFPISLGLVKLRKEMRDKILLSTAIIVTLACLSSLGWAFYQYSRSHDQGWLYNDSVSFLIGQQSIYTSVFVNISIYIFTYFLFYKESSQAKKFLLGLAILALFIISYLLASRNMMLILYASTIIFSFSYILKRRRYLEGATVLFGLLFLGFLVFKFFPKTINRFRELAFTQFNYQSNARESHYNGQFAPDQWNGANFRLAAWSCGWQLFKEHPLTGVDLGDKKDVLFKMYEQKQFHFAIATRKNVHNNYLDILLSMGVAGLVLFLLGWIVLPFTCMIRNKDGLAFLILITLALAMITENYFDRSIGSMLFSFFVTFLLASSDKQKAGGVV